VNLGLRSKQTIKTKAAVDSSFYRGGAHAPPLEICLLIDDATCDQVHTRSIDAVADGEGSEHPWGRVRVLVLYYISR